MKKKIIIAALLAGLIAATCLSGYTCGKGEQENPGNENPGITDGEGSGNADGGENSGGNVQQGFEMEKGVEVTAQEWASAFSATLSLKNYSMYGKTDSTVNIAGNYKGSESLPVNITGSSKTDANCYCDLDNDVVYALTPQQEQVTGFTEMYSLDYLDVELFVHFRMFISKYYFYFWDAEDMDESWNTENYHVKIDGTFYHTYGSTKTGKWQVETEDTLSEIIPMLTVECATEEDGELKPVYERFDDFVFSDGAYSAELWISDRLYTYSLSFKDGYVLCSYAISTQIEEEEGLTISDVDQMLLKFYDLGKTTATPSTEAVKAVQDYIKENA